MKNKIDIKKANFNLSLCFTAKFYELNDKQTNKYSKEEAKKKYSMCMWD